MMPSNWHYIITVELLDFTLPTQKLFPLQLPQFINTVDLPESGNYPALLSC